MTRYLTACLILLAFALTAAPASAATRNQILRDCALDGKLDGTYTAAELRDARRTLPTDSDEYSDCADQLRDAELRAVAASRGGGGDGPAPGGGTGAAPGAIDPGTAIRSTGPVVSTGSRPGPEVFPNDEEAKRLDTIRGTERGPVRVDGADVQPRIGTVRSGALTDPPAALIAALAVVGLGLLGFAAQALRRRVAGRGAA